MNIKKGQVWRRGHEKVTVIAVSAKLRRVMLSGVVDMDPEWDIDYLLKEFQLDKNYE